MTPNITRITFASLLLMAVSLTAGAQSSYRLAESQDHILKAENLNIATTGDRTVVSLDIVLDSVHVPSNRYRAYTPVLYSFDGTQSQKLKTLIATGRRQDIVFQRDGIDELYRDNCVTMRRHNDTPQTYNYTDAIPYQPWHETAQVKLECDLCGCGDPYKQIVYALERPISTGKPEAIGLVDLANLEPDPEKRAQELHGTAFINFVVDRWEMKPDYMSNATELRKITDTLDIMVADPNITVERIMIHGWASPESPYEHNRMLATNRAKSLTEWVRNKYQLPASAFAPAQATPENWIGLQKAVEEMGTDLLPHRSEILALIQDNSMKPDPKEQLIKRRYPQEYQYLLKNVYPWLRRSDYEITFRVRTFNTTEECLDIYKRKPHQLSLHEFWRVAQTMEPYSDDYNRCLQTALNYYPDQPAALINMANVALKQEDLLKAETLLEHAGNSAQAENARAVLYILREDYTKAEQYLNSAAAKGLDVTKNREAIKMMRDFAK